MAHQLQSCQYHRVGGRGRRERQENSGEAREDSDSHRLVIEERPDLFNAIEGEEVGETSKRWLTVAAVLIAREGGRSAGGHVQSPVSKAFPRHPCPPARVHAEGLGPRT